MSKDTLVNGGIVVTGCDTISHCPVIATALVRVRSSKPVLEMVTVAVEVAPTCKGRNVTVLTPSSITTLLIVTAISGIIGMEAMVWWVPLLWESEGKAVARTLFVAPDKGVLGTICQPVEIGETTPARGPYPEPVSISKVTLWVFSFVPVRSHRIRSALVAYRLSEATPL